MKTFLKQFERNAVTETVPYYISDEQKFELNLYSQHKRQNGSSRFVLSLYFIIIASLLVLSIVQFLFAMPLFSGLLQ